uniref:Uncharacterized protein n=1 Tax=Panagrolaimus superbus TaxID=310955 RepID=A0A914YE86_9BILA
MVSLLLILENQSTSGGSETAVNSGFQLPLSQSFIRNSSTATLDRLCYVLLAELFRRHKKLENIENKRRRPSSSSHGGGIVDEYGSHKKDDVQYKTPKHHGSGNLLSPGISAHWQSSHPGWRDGKYLVEENRWQYRSSNKKGQRLPSENDVEFNTDERWFRNERTPSKSAAPARPVGIFLKGEIIK